MSATPESFPRPTRSLARKVAIVTGAGALGSGIGNGRAASILLAEVGCSVVCVDIDINSAQRTVSMISDEAVQKSTGGSAIAVSGDISSESECKKIVDAAMQKYGRLDILVNNVGIMGARGTATEVDLEDWDMGMAVNVKSMVMMAKYSIPAMLESNPPGSNGEFYRGCIVNLGSVAGLRGGTPSLLYPTAKGAVVNMTRAMAYQHAEQGIRVNCVCPGMLYTPMMYAAGGGGGGSEAMSAEMREKRRNRSLLKTEGNGWDCGAAVRFLASDEAR
jgi:NAD(P)-dependent dehydrogenase (short-subunit alcohol dehydrogenase family)